ncbi:MAG: DUF488 family protein [Synergistales bacterium]|nr:DUF488 family protein [Synergistales bacterium]
MSIAMKRVYEDPGDEDGYRVLVDRLWPRGISKEKARIDEWIKDAAPSDELRKSYHSGKLGWEDFREQYLKELENHGDMLFPLAGLALKQKVTLVFSSREEKYNNAAVLKEYLEDMGSEK